MQRSRFAQKLNVPKRTPSPLRSLRPCWTAFLSILRECAPVVPHGGPSKFSRATIVFPQPSKLSRRVTSCLAALREQSQCHGCCCDCLRVLAVNRRVGPNNIRLKPLIGVTHWFHAAKGPGRMLKKVRQRRSRFAQKLNVPKRTPRLFARCGLAGRPF